MDEGESAARQAVALNPNNVAARSNLATARYQAGHLAAARSAVGAPLVFSLVNILVVGVVAAAISSFAWCR